MDWTAIFTFAGKLTSVLAAIAAAWWAYEKWRKRDEHFPRVYFEVSVNFLGIQNNDVVCELVALIENKGVVPWKTKDFTFVLRGVRRTDQIIKGGPKIRGQAEFPHVLDRGRFVPEDWEYSFIYPGVKTEYNFVTTIGSDISFVRMEAAFAYLANGETHHAAKVLKVPEFGAP